MTLTILLLCCVAIGIIIPYIANKICDKICNSRQIVRIYDESNLPKIADMINDGWEVVRITSFKDYLVAIFEK